MSQEYKVKLEIFEGPLDLLLYLVKQDEVDIYDISIERITQQYLGFIEAFKALDLEIAGEFLVMASNLLYIKSRSLLPVDQQPPEEEAEEDDPRWELIRQLVEYKKFKEAAAALGEKEAIQSSVFARSSETNEPPPERPLGEVSIFDLINAFNNVLKRLAPKTEDLREIFEENFTVSDKIDLIMKMTSGGVPLLFSELFSGAVSRGEIVVTFLALLELVRLKQLRCSQSGPFGDIELVRASAGSALFQTPTEAPVEASAEVPVEASAEVPVEVSAEVPVEASAEVPVEASAEVAPVNVVEAELTAEAPAEASTDAPANA